jgi:hypothetical protein
MVGEPTEDQFKGALNNNSQWDADAHRIVMVDSSGTKIDSSNSLPIKLKNTGLESIGNTSQSNLGISGVFTGTWEDCLNYGVVTVGISVDQDSAIDGLRVEWSHDGITVDDVDTFTVFANTSKVFSFGPARRYCRIVYTNDGIITTKFDLQTILRNVYTKSSSHRIQDNIVGEDDVEVVKAIMAGKDEINGLFENVSTFKGALSISDGLRHKTGLNLKLHQPDTVSTTIAVATVVNDTSLTVVDATGFTVGMDIEVYSDRPTGELFFRITNIVGNVITLDQPVPEILDVGHSVERTVLNLNVAGSLAAPQIFYIAPPPGAIWQLTRLIISMTDDTVMDDGTFGGVPALTNGVVIRVINNGVYANAAIWKTNGDIASDMYDTNYVAKPPSGTGYGFRARWTLAAMQAVVELDGDTGDRLEILVQDDLSGLISLKIKAQGRLYGG